MSILPKPRLALIWWLFGGQITLAFPKIKLTQLTIPKFTSGMPSTSFAACIAIEP
jgi:hypothetical protein